MLSTCVQAEGGPIVVGSARYCEYGCEVGMWITSVPSDQRCLPDDRESANRVGSRSYGRKLVTA
jgi:hypothetical protein